MTDTLKDVSVIWTAGVSGFDPNLIEFTAFPLAAKPLSTAGDWPAVVRLQLHEPLSKA